MHFRNYLDSLSWLTENILHNMPCFFFRTQTTLFGEIWCLGLEMNLTLNEIKDLDWKGFDPCQC